MCLVASQSARANLPATALSGCLSRTPTRASPDSDLLFSAASSRDPGCSEAYPDTAPSDPGLLGLSRTSPSAAICTPSAPVSRCSNTTLLASQRPRLLLDQTQSPRSATCSKLNQILPISIKFEPKSISSHNSDLFCQKYLSCDLTY